MLVDNGGQWNLGGGSLASWTMLLFAFDIEVHNNATIIIVHHNIMILGAACTCGSPYIIFISTSGI